MFSAKNHSTVSAWVDCMRVCEPESVALRAGLAVSRLSSGGDVFKAAK